MRFCCSLERDARISELFFDGLVRNVVLEKIPLICFLIIHKNPKEEEEYIYAQTQ